MKPTEMMAMFLRAEAYAQANKRPNVANWARKQYRKYRAIYMAGWSDVDVGRTA